MGYDIIDMGAEDARVYSDHQIELLKDRNKLARATVLNKQWKEL